MLRPLCVSTGELSSHYTPLSSRLSKAQDVAASAPWNSRDDLDAAAGARAFTDL